eukprot:4223830-Lingulodinium_polyedra.AAC.1
MDEYKVVFPSRVFVGVAKGAQCTPSQTVRCRVCGVVGMWCWPVPCAMIWHAKQQVCIRCVCSFRRRHSQLFVHNNIN